jgi:hypothetical protein
MARMQLYWPIDPKGYRIEYAEPASGGAADTIAGEGAKGPSISIVRNGGRLDFQDRFKIDGLYRRLAGQPLTNEGSLDFVSRYGFLRATKREEVSYICHQIEVFRSLIEARDRRDSDGLLHWLNNNSHAIRLNPRISGDPLEFFFQPATLLDALYIQFFEDSESGAEHRLCARPGCGNWFKFGPGTDHRQTARYCSPKCQKAHAYTKTKKGNRR